MVYVKNVQLFVFNIITRLVKIRKVNVSVLVMVSNKPFRESVCHDWNY